MTDKAPADTNVIDLVAYLTGDRPPEAVLDAARGAHLDPVVVIGRDAAGDLSITSSDGDPAQVVYLLECARRLILDEVEG